MTLLQDLARRLLAFLGRALWHLALIFRKQYFPFYVGHSYLSDADCKQVAALVEDPDDLIINEYEKVFAGFVGTGDATSFATGRMAFFALMKCLRIGRGDEVILTGWTCSVMATAVQRIGATPIYADIDIGTYGSSVFAIETCVSEKTKLIVAQHSFGIPCDVRAIMALCERRSIFLLEDCALSFGSSLNCSKVGDIGNAAPFSTDKTKPINTLYGGLIYTKDSRLNRLLKQIQSHSESLSKDKQKKIYSRFKLERILATPSRYKYLKIYDFCLALTQKFFIFEDGFFGDDFSPNSKALYPYPARFPSFLARVGLLELDRWPHRANQISATHKVLKNRIETRLSSFYMTPVDVKKEVNLVPLRYVFQMKSIKATIEFRKKLKRFLDVDGIWFQSPIVCATEPLTNYRYEAGVCPKAEGLSLRVINFPCYFDQSYLDLFLFELDKAINETSGHL